MGGEDKSRGKKKESFFLKGYSSYFPQAFMETARDGRAEYIWEAGLLVLRENSADEDRFGWIRKVDWERTKARGGCCYVYVNLNKRGVRSSHLTKLKKRKLNKTIKQKE